MVTTTGVCAHGKHADRSRPQWRGPGRRRALRLAALALLLPAPVALAAPQPTSLPTERLLAMSHAPATGIDPALMTRVLELQPQTGKAWGGVPRDTEAPQASMTRVAKDKSKSAAVASQVADTTGIPVAALRAYRAAEATMNIADPSCRLTWGLLAGIGRVESDHGRYGGSVLGRDGQSRPQILGLPLNGVGAVAAIADTDDGRLDGDRRWDRAVGPMQFIPSTWAMVGVDGDGDGERNPHDIADAALAAAVYLCVGDGDLGTAAGVHDAVFSYNHSEEYVALVVGIANAYQSGMVDLALLAPMGAPNAPSVPVALNAPDGRPNGAGDSARARDKRGQGEDRKRTRDRSDDTADRPGGKSDRRGSGRDDSPSDTDDSAPTRPQDRSEGPGSNEDRGGSTGDRGPDGGKGSVDEPKTPETDPQPQQKPGSEGDAGEVVEEAEPVKQEEIPDQEEMPDVPPPAEPTEYTGTVTAKGDAFYLDNYLLRGPSGYEDAVGEVITVLAVLDGETLIVQ